MFLATLSIRTLTSTLLALSLGVLAHAGPIPQAVSFVDTPVNIASAAKTLTLTLSAAGALSGVQTLMLGTPNRDFKRTGGSCRPDVNYGIGDTCTVNVIFKPSLPGGRNGAVTLTSVTGSTVAITYLTGKGIGPLMTFAPGVPTLIEDDIVGLSAFTVDGNGSIYVAVNASPQAIYKISPGGGRALYATVPMARGYLEKLAIDGAGNLFANDPIGSQVLKIDTSKVVTVIAANLDSNFGMAVDGAGNAYVALTFRAIRISPTGAQREVGGLGRGEYGPLLGLAIDDSSNVFLEANGLINEGYSNMFGAQSSGLAVDASETLLIGVVPGANAPEGCPDPLPNPGDCPGTAPPIPTRQLAFVSPMVGPDGNIYALTVTGANPALYRLNRLNPSPLLFVSQGSQGSTGSVAVTNSGNLPLNLSQLKQSITGPRCSQQFSIQSSTCSGSLPPAATCTTTFSYSPASPTATGLLSVSGIPNSTQFIVPLQGYLNR